ncbi:hypothetical protein BCD67_03070 [Oscillatoriales cyanobacterium USR001]|nr:hypothetical protein BCD67_03070 [Oscillatoriales cyanobacterium USR001]
MNPSANQWNERLQDIVENVQINADFSIIHPLYRPVELSIETYQQWQLLPEEIKNDCLLLKLRSFIHAVYFNCSFTPNLSSNQDDEKDSNFNIENNKILGIDPLFYNQLHQSNQGTGYYDDGWLVQTEKDDNCLIVTKDIKLHIQRDQHLHPDHKTATVGDKVAILLPKNLIQNRIYIAVGNAGKPQTETPQQSLVCIYFNLMADGLIPLMASLTKELNQQTIPFTWEVLYNPEDYITYDAGILYFHQDDYENVKSILTPIYGEQKQFFKPQTPLFTKPIAPGLGLAEVPNHQFYPTDDFGRNRCQIIAKGLLTCWLSGDNSPQARITAIEDNFHQLGIDLNYPYLNPDSTDIYRYVVALQR